MRKLISLTSLLALFGCSHAWADEPYSNQGGDQAEAAHDDSGGDSSSDGGDDD